MAEPSTTPAPGNASGNPAGSPAPGSAPHGGPALKTWRTLNPGEKRSEVPEGLWTRCKNCDAMLYTKALREAMWVCPECDYHDRIGADERIAQLVDPGSFEAMWTDLKPVDTLSFVDRLPYGQRIEREQKKTGHQDALVAGRAFVKGRGVVMAVMNNQFMMASMGSVVGEKITRAIELATDEDRTLIVVCAGGGARMQESTLAVSQMIKTSAALARFDDAGGLYLALLTDPTTGGTAASFAMLGDITLAEPKALIGFTGARVIANTVRQELPEGFQRAEFLVEKGFVDRVVHRHELRNEIARLIDYAGK